MIKQHLKSYRPRVVGLLVAVSLLCVPALIGDAIAQAIIPYLSAGYRVKVVPFGSEAGFEQPDFDDSSFAVGDAAFGSGGFCPLDTTVTTFWPLDTDLLLRKSFFLPANTSDIEVAVAIDNDVQVFVNGSDISTGLRLNEGCAVRDRFVFPVPEHILVRGGDNLLAVRARDRGAISYVDVEVRAGTQPGRPACASAVPITLPFTSAGAEITPSGVDSYAISARAGDIINLDIDADVVGSTLDAMVAVFDAGCNQLALNDDDGESLDSFLHFTVPSTGTFFIGVTSFADFAFVGGPDSFTSGPYRLSVRTVRFTGRTREVGFAGRGAVTSVGVFTLDKPIDLSACPATATITQLLNEEVGNGELVTDLPLTLNADCRNTKTTARYETPVGAVPHARLTIGARDRGRFTFRLEVSGATIAVPALCPTTHLTTVFAIDDGTNPPTAIAGAPASTCFGVGNRYLKTDP